MCIKVTTKIKLFYFVFCLWIGYILPENLVWENVVYIITFLVKFF